MPPLVVTASHSRLRHIPALDGLRGLALLGVLLFHADGALRGGYLGVDLFFVLSGYLITTLLLAEHEAQGRIALGDFWVRRFRRLMPALLSLMPAIALHAWLLAAPVELPGLRADALATLGYVANWRAILAHKSYWDLFNAPSPLEHTWSLAIEEQFYVLWPLLVVAVLRRRTPRFLLGVTLALLGLSVAAMLAQFDPASPSRVYLGTDTRAAGILAGAAFAVLLPPSTALSAPAVRALDALGLASALGLGVAWVRLEGSSPLLYRGGLWLTELGALALVACAVAGPRSLVARALAWRPLTLVGTISYGLYLWHWPVNVALTPARTHLHGLALHALRFALTFAIATASYRWFERPLRQRGLRSGRPAVVVPAALAAAVALVLASTQPRGGAIDPARPPASALAASEPPAPGAPPWRLMVLGDSTANSLGWVVRGVREPGLIVDLKGQDGCSMLIDSCHGEDWAGYLEQLRPDVTLVFLGGAFLHGMTADGAWRKSCHPAWDRAFKDTLQGRLGDLSAARGPVWVATIPYPLGPYDEKVYRQETDCINASIREAARAVPGVRVLDVAGRLCPGGACTLVSDGVSIRPDGVHYTMEGAAALARWMVEGIRPHPLSPSSSDGEEEK